MNNDKNRETGAGQEMDSEKLNQPGAANEPIAKTEKPNQLAGDVKGVLEAARKDGLISEALESGLGRVITALTEEKDQPLDQNPQALDQAAETLTTMGGKESDIDKKSLVLESENDKRLAKLNSLSRSATAPTMNYRSNVGFYGVQARLDESSGKPELLYSRGVFEKFLCWAENQIRKANDQEGGILGNLFSKGKRKKVTLEEAAKHAQDLGLGEFKMENGLLIEEAKDIREGAFLDDLLRQAEGQDFLEKIDKAEAVRMAGKTLADMHKKSRIGIGEVLANDLVLKIENGKITAARLTLPDTCYELEVDELEQKATDMLDFCFSVASAGWQSGGESSAIAYLEAALIEYDLDMVRIAMKSLVEKRPMATAHNLVRLGFDRVPDKDLVFRNVRTIIKNIL